MTKDIVERLREASGYALMDNARVTVLEAADEIERLRGSTVERRFCEPTVAGSTPAAGFSGGDQAVTKPMPKEKRAEVYDGKPVAWAVVYPNDEVAVIAFKRRDADERASASDRVIPLYRHPPCQDFSQKNLTLTDCEREAVEECVRFSFPATHPTSATLRGLLERLK